MTTTIWKYPISTPAPGELGEIYEISLAVGAEIVRVASQLHHLKTGDRFNPTVDEWMVCLWALLDPESSGEETRRFLVRRTGEPVDPAWTYLGLAQTHQFYRSWHVFEVPPDPADDGSSVIQ